MGSRRTLIVVGIAAVVVLAAVVAALLLVGREGQAQPAPVVAGLDQTLELLDGIPQDGTALGHDDAPVTLVEYADMQCPHCAHFARDGFPHLVWDYVREGDLRMEFRGLHFMGPDSERALRAVLAAGLQDRLWHVSELLFYAQGDVNAGWVTDDLLRSVAEAVPGLDADRMFADMDAEQVEQWMAEAQRDAEAAQVPGTPAFQIGRTGEEVRSLEVPSLAIYGFRPAIEQMLED
jgi:protein-disulfide isomerase